MNYYQHNIGDYRRDTAHLSLLEHGIYRQLLDWYYLDEKEIPKETQVVFRRLSAKTQDEKNAIEIILNEFFVETETGWIHKRCDSEITAYKHKADINRKNGKLGGRPKKTQSVIYGNPDESESKPKKTLTNNHKPITNIYTPEFEQFWMAYPKRHVSDNKASAFKAWNARLKDGESESQMIDGAKNYAVECDRTNRSGTEFVKAAATFLGPNKHYADFQQAQQPVRAKGQLRDMREYL